MRQLCEECGGRNKQPSDLHKQMRYYITSYGHNINPTDPGFATLAEARVALKADLKTMLVDAKRRWGKGATIIGNAVYAMRNRQSPLWGALSIVQC